MQSSICYRTLCPLIPLRPQIRISKSIAVCPQQSLIQPAQPLIQALCCRFHSLYVRFRVCSLSFTATACAAWHFNHKLTESFRTGYFCPRVALRRPSPAPTINLCRRKTLALIVGRQAIAQHALRRAVGIARVPRHPFRDLPRLLHPR
jgi:hypothetical protein